MATGIEWCDLTWNIVTGCSKVSDGCAHCYAEKMSKRLAGRFGYDRDNPFKVKFHADRQYFPDKFRKPKKIFLNSMGDIFHEDVPISWIYRVWDLMKFYKDHTFIVLTKRPDNIAGKLMGIDAWPHNIWLGVTAENQEEAARRIPILLQIPAAVRFVSCEPLLEHVNLMPWMRCPACSYTEADKRYHMDHRYCHNAGWNGLDWVIAGAEKGPGARPCYVEWIGSLWEQCRNAQVPFFFKQWAGKVETVYPPELVEIQNTRQFPGQNNERSV